MEHITVEPSGSGAVQAPRRDRVDPPQASRLAWSLWLLVVLVQGLLAAFVLGHDAMSVASGQGRFSPGLPSWPSPPWAR